MMCSEVLNAVEEGNFRLWAIDKIEDGIPILMGIEAGEVDKDGNYPDNSLFGRAIKQVDLMREWAKEGDESTNKKKNLNQQKKKLSKKY